ncbi:MAG: hypothetical protein ACSLFI_05625 [Solirubrobacterales bacterium]
MLIAVVGGLLLAMALPAPALANIFVEEDGSSLRVTGDVDDSFLSIQTDGSMVRLNGNGAPIDVSPGSGCAMPGGINTVWDCPGPPTFTLLVVKMGDGNDVICPSGCTPPAGMALDLDGGPNADTSPPRHEEITGSATADVIYGGDSYDTLDGAAGNDDIDGGPENDKILGGVGDDTIRARDGQQDDSINCGGGTNDVAIVDKADTNISNCETVQLPGGGGGGSTGCVPGYGCFPATGTTRTKAFPNLVGLHQRAAQNKLNSLGMDWTPASPKHPVKVKFMTANRLPKHPQGKKFHEGDVIKQRPAPGTPTTYSVADQVDVAVTIWGGPERESCTQAAKDFSGIDLVTWTRTMKDLRCNLDDLSIALRPKGTTKPSEVDLSSGDRCEVARTSRQSRKAIDATLQVPADPALQDIRLGFREVYLGPSFIASDNDREAWSLPITGGQGVQMVISAQDRQGALLDGVRLYLDASGVGGGLVDAGKTDTVAGKKAMGGSRSVSVDTTRTGVIRVVGVASDRNGNSICGVGQVRVTDPGKEYVTVSGNGWKQKDGKWVRSGDARAEPVAGGPQAAVSRGGLGGFFEAARDFLVGLFAPFHPKQSGDVSSTLSIGSPRKAVNETFRTYDAAVVQIWAGEPLNGAARPGLIGPDGGSLIGMDGASLIGPDGGSLGAYGTIDGRRGNVLLGVDRQGNLIGADGSSLVGPDGSSLIGADGSSLVGPDGSSIAPALKDMQSSKIVSFGTASLVGNGGNTLIGADGSSLMSATSPMVAAGAGNLISDNGAR